MTSKIISRKDYDALVGLFDPYCELDQLIDQFIGYEPRMLRAIYCQWITHYVKKHYPRHSTNIKANDYYKKFIKLRQPYDTITSSHHNMSISPLLDNSNDYHKGNKNIGSNACDDVVMDGHDMLLVELAKKLLLPPCIMARIIIKRHLEIHGQQAYRMQEAINGIHESSVHSSDTVTVDLCDTRNTTVVRSNDSHSTAVQSSDTNHTGDSVTVHSCDVNDTLADSDDDEIVAPIATSSVHSNTLSRSASPLNPFLTTTATDTLASNDSLASNAESTDDITFTITTKKITKILRNPMLLADDLLAKNIARAVSMDRHFSPTEELRRSANGEAHESLLESFLLSQGIAFETEGSLRSKGYPKTPDIMLLVPVAISLTHTNNNEYTETSNRNNLKDCHSMEASNNGDYVIINWIESKASFGDLVNHSRYLRDQYWAYHNRFGPGLVIYWAGYIAEINNLGSKGILISHDLPSRIIPIQSVYL